MKRKRKGSAQTNEYGTPDGYPTGLQMHARSDDYWMKAFKRRGLNPEKASSWARVIEHMKQREMLEPLFWSMPAEIERALPTTTLRFLAQSKSALAQQCLVNSVRYRPRVEREQWLCDLFDRKGCTQRDLIANELTRSGSPQHLSRIAEFLRQWASASGFKRGAGFSAGGSQQWLVNYLTAFEEESELARLTLAWLRNRLAVLPTDVRSSFVRQCPGLDDTSNRAWIIIVTDRRLCTERLAFQTFDRIVRHAGMVKIETELMRYVPIFKRLAQYAHVVLGYRGEAQRKLGPIARAASLKQIWLPEPKYQAELDPKGQLSFRISHRSWSRLAQQEDARILHSVRQHLPKSLPAGSRL